MLLLPKRVANKAALASDRHVRVDQAIAGPNNLAGTEPGFESPETLPAPTSEARSIAQLCGGNEGDEEVAPFDVLAIRVCDGCASAGELGAKDIGVDDDGRTPCGHASAIALKKASSSSSVKP